VKPLALWARDMQSVLPMPEAISAMKEVFAELSTGNVVAPTRLHVPVAAFGGVSLFMAAHSPRLGLAAKAVSVFPGTYRGPGCRCSMRYRTMSMRKCTAVPRPSLSPWSRLG